MPEFEALLSFSQKLRLAIPFRRPYTIGKLMAEIANMQHYDLGHIMQIYADVDAAVGETYGEDGQTQFRASFNRYFKRRRR